MERSDTTSHQKLVDHLKCEMGNAIRVYCRSTDRIGFKILNRKRETLEILAESVGYDCELVETVTKETETVEWEFAKIACTERVGG